MSGQAPQFVGKVALTCPHCGFKQLESPYAKSTFCRKCGGHYEPGKPPAPKKSDGSSFLERVGQLFNPQKTREITCFDCGAVQTISASSTSSLCPRCSTYIDVSDFRINTPFSRLIQTQGVVRIEAKADVTSSKVACREAYIEGKLRGNLLCTGTAYVDYEGKISGSLEAKHVQIKKGCDAEFIRTIKARSIEIAGKISANLRIDGVVKILKRGRLEGGVYARSIIVEKGGVFLGELSIGQPAEPVQPELEAAPIAVEPAAIPAPPPLPPKKAKQDAQPDLGLL